MLVTYCNNSIRIADLNIDCKHVFSPYGHIFNHGTGIKLTVWKWKVLVNVIVWICEKNSEAFLGGYHQLATSIFL